MPTIALVGAGTRLGLSLGRVFGKHGFDVALVARSGEGLGELAEKLAAEGVKAAGFPADVTDRPTLIAALDRAVARDGGSTAATPHRSTHPSNRRWPEPDHDILVPQADRLPDKIVSPGAAFGRATQRCENRATYR